MTRAGWDRGEPAGGPHHPVFAHRPDEGPFLERGDQRRGSLPLMVVILLLVANKKIMGP